MVSNLSIISMFITLILSLLLPVVILLMLRKGQKGVTGVWIAGALGFFIPQLVIRVPALQILSMLTSFQEFAKNHPYLYVFSLALTAGLFETAGRLFVLKGFLSKKLSYMAGLVSGAGHGGIEAIAIVGLTYVNNIVISFFINAGKLSTIVPKNPALAEHIQQALSNTSPILFLAAGFERIFTMMFHIAMSILLTLFIIKKRVALGFVLVTLLHFITDFLAVIMQLQGGSTLAIEAVILVIALASLVLTIKIRPYFGDRVSISVDPAEQAVKEGY